MLKIGQKSKETYTVQSRRIFVWFWAYINDDDPWTSAWRFMSSFVFCLLKNTITQLLSRDYMNVTYWGGKGFFEIATIDLLSYVMYHLYSIWVCFISYLEFFAKTFWPSFVLLASFKFQQKGFDNILGCTNLMY